MTPDDDIDGERDDVKLARHQERRQQRAAIQHVPQLPHGCRERNEQHAETVAERLPRAEQKQNAGRVAGNPDPPGIDDTEAGDRASKDCSLRLPLFRFGARVRHCEATFMPRIFSTRSAASAYSDLSTILS